MKPVVFDYTDRVSLGRVLNETVAKNLFSITDYLSAANASATTEIADGKNTVDAAKASKIEHVISVSVSDAELFNEDVRHMRKKVVIEDYLRNSGVPFSF